MHHRPEDHTDKCFCGRPAAHHIAYDSGCGNVCGIHKNAIARRKGKAAVTVTAVVVV